MDLACSPASGYLIFIILTPQGSQGHGASHLFSSLSDRVPTRSPAQPRQAAGTNFLFLAAFSRCVLLMTSRQSMTYEKALTCWYGVVGLTTCVPRVPPAPSHSACVRPAGCSSTQLLAGLPPRRFQMCTRVRALNTAPSPSWEHHIIEMRSR